jgi:2-hydroxycyclohexanecarboxyl-CoA dehydrogenase
MPDRTAIVTGAGSARGIGRATALRLARDGFAVSVWDIDGTAAKDAAEAIAAETGAATLGVECDVTDPGAVDRAANEVEQNLPPVAALVNNAGITSPTRFLDISPEELDRIFAVNVRGTVLPMQRILPGMIEREYGRVVNLSSVSAERGGGIFGGSHYSAAKAAILGLTRAVAREVGTHGIVLNSVAPGLIDTDITGGKLTPEIKAQLVSDIPVGRTGTTADVAAIIAFLCSEDAGYITGATVDINGGSHIH